MISLRHIKNQVIFYIKKYGIVKTLKKCVKVILLKIKKIFGEKKVINYGDYGDWIRTNEVSQLEIEKQRTIKFDYMPKISLIVPMYHTNEKSCILTYSYFFGM